MHTRFLLLVLIAALLAGCGTPNGGATVEYPTPTPLPPDPALEKPTYTVERGAIERIIEVTGRVTPVNLSRLAFRREGRVNVVNVKRGDSVKAGDVLAELQQEEALDELRRAQDDLVQAERDLETAKIQYEREVQQRELDVEAAEENLKRLLPGGDDDILAVVRKAFDDADREARRAKDDLSKAKTEKEEALTRLAEDLLAAQEKFSTARWNLDWVLRYGTDPTVEPQPGVPRPRVSAQRRREFQQAFNDAERGLKSAERAVEQGKRDLELAREDEILKNQEAEEKLRKAREKLDAILNGRMPKEVQEAERALANARLQLEELRRRTFNSELRAIENARRALDKATRRVDEGRITATEDGQVLAVAIEAGATIQAFTPVFEVADPSELEFAATLNGEQMRQLTEGQPAEIRLLVRPDVVLPAVIRQMPAPYGSGGSGSVQDRDPTTRFQVLDARGLQLVAGQTVGRISIVLERRENILRLPPEAIRTFEGRRFVIVREGDLERRVTIRIGLQTPEQVEILEGLNEGDVVVGP